MPKSPILGQFSKSRAQQAADSLSVNLGLELVETKDGYFPGFLFLQSGLDLIMTVGDGPIRGELALNDTLYVVSGSQVYSVDAIGAVTLCGNISADTTPVSMFQNKSQLMIVDGVGGWIVPGGYPMTGGTISAGGSLYAVNDTISLQAATGKQSAYPLIEVTSVAQSPVTAYFMVNSGTTYSTASNVATTGIQPQPGAGSGLTVNITSVSGTGFVTGVSVNAGGTGYVVGDTGYISGGGRLAVYRVTTVGGGGAVGNVVILNGASGYSTGTNIPTSTAPGVPANIGTGFTLNITASGGPITASSLVQGGRNYVVGNVGFVNGGTADATYLVTAIGPTGVVTGFKVIDGGAIDASTTAFTQKTTSGSGQGFALSGPSFGAFVGLVPVTLPFDRPIVGGVSDGFGVLVFQGSQNIAASDQEDLSTWNPLSFGVANQSPDNAVSLAIIHDEVYILKEGNTEVWIDEGLTPFPFSPQTQVHMEHGIAAPFSVAIADEELIWLSRNSQGQGVFVKAEAFRVSYIGTQALTAAIQKYDTIDDCIAYVRQEGAHVYYVATFPSANATWCYDKTTSALLGYPVWYQLAAFDNGVLNRHWGNAFTQWANPPTSVTTTTAYNPLSVLFASDTQLQTPVGLVGLPTSFSSFLFSIWLDIPDTTGAGMVFTNQGGSANPGISITIQNDTNGSPQISIECWDAASSPIVTATYNFTTWAAWVNLMVSVDTSTQQIQVWANTVVSSALVETELTPASLTWHTSNPIGASTATAWTVGLVA